MNEIVLPRLGWTMEEGIFRGWLKAAGELVQAGEPLFAMEGDKSTQEIESIESGILQIPDTSPREGDTVRVGAVLGYLIPSQQTSLPSATKPQRQAITPRARRAAKQWKVDLAKVVGTGRHGRVRERDVLSAVQNLERGSKPPEPIPSLSPPPSPLPRMTPHRQLIAERMAHSQRMTAPVTLTTTVDASNLVSLRNQFKAAKDRNSSIPSYTDILTKLVSLTLAEHPNLNARLQEDQLVTFKETHIGIAVDTDAGLVVPVMHNVQAMTLQDVVRESRALVDNARARRLKPEMLQGGTFTITNLGAYGIDAFTPIINWPEVAILGVGRIQRLPVVVGEQIVIRDRMTLSLTFDHRAMDGAPAARFLQTLTHAIENPAAWLLTNTE